MLRVTDAALLAGMTTTSLIVVNGAKTRTGELRATVQRLAQSGSPIAGIVLNRLMSRGAGYYYGSYETLPERRTDTAAVEPAARIGSEAGDRIP
jgi:Mrp family chromosome partitioning ATPase